MAVRPLPTQDELRNILRYNPETGSLFWRRRPVSMFEGVTESAEFTSKKWNGRFAGRIALNHKSKGGYKSGSCFGKQYQAHRIIWKLMTGDEPETIDHINGNPSDNRWKNLRGASRVENQKNMAMRKDNSSGVVGVSWQPAKKRWFAYLNSAGKRVNIGRFKSFQDAVAARKAAEIQYGFHPNHGRKGVSE